MVWEQVKDVNPGDKVENSAKIKAPKAVGEYIIEFDMVQEQVVLVAETLRLDVVVE
ncbi:MAG: hypothetical protein JW920_01530 [Deltaproteobacteria bacterium]|nr:hypothetical protein [Deltaproteobacteria bacterium]